MIVLRVSCEIVVMVKIWRILLFISSLLIGISHQWVIIKDFQFFFIFLTFSFKCQHLGFYFSDFKLTYLKKYMNLSINMGIYKNNTKSHPVYLVPEATITIFEDIPRLHVRRNLYNFWLENSKTFDFTAFNVRSRYEN